MTTCDRNLCDLIPHIIEMSVWWRLDLAVIHSYQPPPLFLPVSIYLSIFSPLLDSLSGTSCYCGWKRLRSWIPPVDLQQGRRAGDCDNCNVPAARWDIQTIHYPPVMVKLLHSITKCTSSFLSSDNRKWRYLTPKNLHQKSMSHCFSIKHICEGNWRFFVVFFSVCVLKPSTTKALKEAAFVFFFSI